VKFKDYLAAITNSTGSIPLPHLRWIIRKNTRNTAREEAIAAEVLRQANPRENISGHFGWGPEEQTVLQQLWMNPGQEVSEWRDVPTHDTAKLFSTEQTKYGPMPVPNAIDQPGQIHHADFHERLKEILGDDFE
jgi:hypothetical protein